MLILYCVYQVKVKVYVYVQQLILYLYIYKRMFMYSIPIIMRKYNNLNLFSENLEIKKNMKNKKENWK